MSADGIKKNINIKLSEHDALKLLALVQKEMLQSEKTWISYWKRLAKTIEGDIENAHLSKDANRA